MSLDALAEAAGMARAAGPADAVGGCPARFVATPGRADQLSALLRQCATEGLTAVPRGDGTKIDWGQQPTTVDVIVDTARLTGVREHSSADLVVTVGAGTPLRALQATLGQSGQRIALDPGSTEATVGGILATNEAGPLSHTYGAPRDLLVGVQFVRADGTVSRSGGKVVKDVAGYDLGKLLCGSYGTLGVITEATFRLHPLPISRVFLIRSVSTPAEVDELVGEMLDSRLAPTAIEVDLPPPVERPVPRQLDGTGPSGSGTLAVLFEGSALGAQARADAAAELIGGRVCPEEQAPTWWGRYPFGPDDVGLRLSVPVADLPAVIYALGDAAGAPVPVRGAAGIGVVYAALPGDLPVVRVAGVLDAVRRVLLARSGSCEVLTAPEQLRAELDLWGPVPGLELMHRIKEQFDPQRLLSPGRFVGGI
ncbi:FAD-binding oxidoreductase [Rugosimonospora africana]|uniref:Glycolate oxidase n=1 Tax=Rugosimonospora africana TaxID=556532 RepID=A0A8J3VNY8_9ACTN|nr:FAD-binding oxidoreductase [Rugosimonospora africana]GIH13407.1 glycolate oxidase [Rugosimonospora africana]